LAGDASPDQKTLIYTCPASICTNANDDDLFEYLMAVLQKETDERTRITILARLKDKPKSAAR
jgi:hypothetical protein